MPSRIADPQLADQVTPEELTWQRHVTPVTQYYCGQVARLDLRGRTLACWQHVTFNTISMLLALRAAGVRVVLGACNVDSTDDRVAAYLAAQGVSVYARRGMDRVEYLDNLARLSGSGAHALCDMGGELICACLDQDPPPLGALEATTSGLHRLRGRRIPFPVFDWNSIPLKDRLENRFHVGDGLWPAFSHVTSLSLFGRRVLVVGFGPVGKGIAERARKLGALVAVAELDPVRLIEAKHHGCEPVSLEAGLARCQVAVTATGVEGVLGAAQLARLRPGAIVLNAGHSNREIDIDWLLQQPGRRIKAHLDRFDLPGTHLYLLAQGSLLNLAAGSGLHGNDLFDLYTAVMLRGIAWVLGGAAAECAPGLQPYPAALEREVATKYLALSEAVSNETEGNAA